MESSQQPAEEASPLGSEEADKEVDHGGDEDDARGHVVQVVESFLIGHHVQVPAGYNTHTQTDTDTHISNTHTYCAVHACIRIHAHVLDIFKHTPNSTYKHTLMIHTCILQFTHTHTIQSHTLHSLLANVTTSPSSVLLSSGQ